MSERAKQLRAGLLILIASLVANVDVAGDARAATETKVVSPDGSVQLKVFLRESRMHYTVSFKNRPVLEEAPLVFSVDGVELTDGTELGEVSSTEIKDSYPWRGVHSKALNHCKAVSVGLKHAKSKTAFSLELRAYNDGVAFRWIVLGEQDARVPDEATRFVLPTGSTVWSHDLEGHYEGVHQKKDIADIKESEWAAPPLTFKLPDGTGYASITEAALVDYSGMALQGDGHRGFTLVLGHKHHVSYPFRLRYTKEDIERLSRPAAISRTICSPWRVIMIGADLNTLVNSDLVPNLCPPPGLKLFPKGIQTEWLKPGRAVWKYLDGGENTLEGMKEFCKQAGELGFEHNIIEGFWQRWSDAQLKELIACGKEHHVGIWLWKHSKDLRDPDTRRAFFKKCHDLGVAGVKVDFFDHEAKEVIDLYQAMLKESAENQLMINFHGSNKPTGEARTWPNEVVREAVKGMEASKLRDRARHDATLPFTRFLAGHADYTPVHFGTRRADTTWAHQVATAAVFTAPLLTYAANPKTILDNPCAPMIKSIPAVWDETIVLPVSEIGEVAAFARRSGDTWFLAIVNGPTGREVRVPLSFLGKGEYRALIVRDHKSDPAAVRVEETSAKHDDALTIELSGGGGFIARFSKK
jgi:alpha-glucosidase